MSHGSEQLIQSKSAMASIYEPRKSNDKTLRVGIAHAHEPYIMPCSLKGFQVRDDCQMPGIAVEVMDFVLRKAGIPYVSVPLNISGVYGVLRENGTRSSYLGAMQKVCQTNTVDLALILGHCRYGGGRIYTNNVAHKRLRIYDTVLSRERHRHCAEGK